MTVAKNTYRLKNQRTQKNIFLIAVSIFSIRGLFKKIYSNR